MKHDHRSVGDAEPLPVDVYLPRLGWIRQWHLEGDPRWMAEAIEYADRPNTGKIPPTRWTLSPAGVGCSELWEYPPGPGDRRNMYSRLSALVGDGFLNPTARFNKGLRIFRTTFLGEIFLDQRPEIREEIRDHLDEDSRRAVASRGGGVGSKKT
jgi:hypothetical protein